MKVTIAYLQEPPFGWTGSDGTATGADLDLADAVLRAIGVTRIEHCLTTFSELLAGVEAGRWDMNVPLFVTPDRAAKVAFSLLVWAIGDGFLVVRKYCAGQSDTRGADRKRCRGGRSRNWKCRATPSISRLVRTSRADGEIRSYGERDRSCTGASVFMKPSRATLVARPLRERSSTHRATSVPPH